jgi:hypothetical protein
MSRLSARFRTILFVESLLESGGISFHRILANFNGSMPSDIRQIPVALVRLDPLPEIVRSPFSDLRQISIDLVHSDQSLLLDLRQIPIDLVLPDPLPKSVQSPLPYLCQIWIDVIRSGPLPKFARSLLMDLRHIPIDLVHSDPLLESIRSPLSELRHNWLDLPLRATWSNQSPTFGSLPTFWQSCPMGLRCRVVSRVRLERRDHGGPRSKNVGQVKKQCSGVAVVDEWRSWGWAGLTLFRETHETPRIAEFRQSGMLRTLYKIHKNTV